MFLCSVVYAYGMLRVLVFRQSFVIEKGVRKPDSGSGWLSNMKSTPSDDDVL